MKGNLVPLVTHQEFALVSLSLSIHPQWPSKGTETTCRQTTASHISASPAGATTQTAGAALLCFLILSASEPSSASRAPVLHWAV